MAGKQQKGNESKKRKGFSGPEKEERNLSSKRLKSQPKKLSQKGSKKVFESSRNEQQQNQLEVKQKILKRDTDTNKQKPIHAKELAEARKKKRKKNDTKQELALLWEKMRRRDIGKEERSKFVTESLNKMKGKIPEIASSHLLSRVLQTCIKHCSQDERNAVFLELRPHLISLATNSYSVHLVTKMLDNASKEQLAQFISSLHGNVALLLRNMVGSLVIEHAYSLGNASQKQALLLELYSPELQLFKDLVSIKETRLIDVISKLQLPKASVNRHMTSVLQPILAKGILDHSIIHRALVEYLTIADESSAAEIIEQVSGPLLVRAIHTKDGSRIGIQCIKHGNAKERKKIIKGMKDQVEKIARDRWGTMVLVCILSIVDDTKLLTKNIIHELEGNLKELMLDQNGRRPILQLLHPFCPRYFSPEDLFSLSSTIPSLSSKGEVKRDSSESHQQMESLDVHEENQGEKDQDEIVPETTEGKSDGKNLFLGEIAKKDPLTRRRELLIDSGFAEKLIDACCETAEDLLRSKFGKEVIYEVATGGADHILRPSMDEKLRKLYEAIACLVAEPKSEGADEHLLEHFHSSRTIRKLILDSPMFASVLWEKALKGKCTTWSQGHSSKVISAFLETSDTDVREMAKKELEPLLESGILRVPAANESSKTDHDSKKE